MDYIPVIDLARISCIKTETKDWEEATNSIREALSGIGFMYLINHGVSEDVIENGYGSSKKFFALPPEVKEKYTKDPQKSSHGWVSAGREILHESSSFEVRECFDYFHPLHRHEGFPKYIPECPDFYPAIERFQRECNILIRKLLKLLGLSLKLEDPDYFLKCSSHLDEPEISSESDFRAIYYPSISRDLEIPVGSVRCGEHTDYEIITLLFQDAVGGLEVKAANGSWVPATPIPNSILVNTGDLLEFWTNKFYPATCHRVIIPKTEITQRIPRYSFAYFFPPDNSTLISPLKSELLKPPQDENIAPITAFDHINARNKQAYQY